jgi:hypothetical protein
VYFTATSINSESKMGFKPPALPPDDTSFRKKKKLLREELGTISGRNGAFALVYILF